MNNIIKFKYLVRKKAQHRQCYHLYFNTDTVCRMHSTGGMNRKRQVILTDKPDLPLCVNCQKNYARAN